MEIDKLINSTLIISNNLDKKKEKIENVNNHQNQNFENLVKLHLTKVDENKSLKKIKKYNY